MDLSFLKLYDSIDDAINDTKFKAGQFFYNLPIQLLPDESYLQITNKDGGISIDSEFFAFVVDCNGNQLADITDNIFVEEFTDYNGNTQCKIEIINLGLDFHGKAVIIKLDLFNTNVEYYTRPILITEKYKNRTYRFDYTNPTTISGIDYTNADCTQAIRLLCKFKGYDNSSEINDYYEISTGNTVSYRPLRQIKERFSIETIDDFTFIRMQELLFHNIIYIDGKRITNKPLLEPNDPFGESNIFSSEFVADIDESDTFAYEPQIFQGFDYVSFSPSGTSVSGSSFTTFDITMTESFTLNTGTVTVFDSADTLIATFTESDMTISSNTLQINVIGSALETPANDSYYCNITSGLITSGLGDDNEAITDSTTWAFALSAADYSSLDYSSEYFIN